MGYYSNMRSIRAQRAIEDGKYDPTDWKRVHELYLAATGDKELAREARLRAMEAYVESETKKK